MSASFLGVRGGVGGCPLDKSSPLVVVPLSKSFRSGVKTTECLPQNRVHLAWMTFMAFRSLGDGLESGWISGYLRSTYFAFHHRAEWILTFSKNVSVKWRRTVRPREKGPSPRCRYVATQRYSQPSRWECWSVQESEISTTVLHTGYYNSFLLNIALDSSVKFPGFDSVRRFARREVEMFSKEILSSSMEISRDHISPNKYFSFWFCQWFVRSFTRPSVRSFELPFIHHLFICDILTCILGAKSESM